MAEIKMSDFKDVTSLLDQVRAEICDNYCKYPERYGFDGRTYQSDNEFDRLIEEHCDKCPLELL